MNLYQLLLVGVLGAGVLVLLGIYRELSDALRAIVETVKEGAEAGGVDTIPGNGIHQAPDADEESGRRVGFRR